MADECENLCRLCIDGGGEAVIDIDGRVGERINSCLPVKVDSSDDLPHRICKPCLHKVDTFYEFTNTCRESERRLIHMIRGEGAATSPSKTSNSLDRTATFVKQEEVDVVVGGSSGGGSFLQKEEEDPDESKSYLFQQRFVEEDESVSLNATSRTGPDNDDDEDEDEEEQPPPPKRAKRTAALKAAIALDQNSDDDLDDDLGEAHTKTEDQTDDSDDNFLVMPSTSGAEGVNAADQPGPSTAVPAASAGRSTSGPGTGADPVEAPSTEYPNGFEAVFIVEQDPMSNVIDLTRSPSFDASNYYNADSSDLVITKDHIVRGVRVMNKKWKTVKPIASEANEVDDVRCPKGKGRKWKAGVANGADSLALMGELTSSFRLPNAKKAVKKKMKRKELPKDAIPISLEPNREVGYLLAVPSFDSMTNGDPTGTSSPPIDGQMENCGVAPQNYFNVNFPSEVGPTPMSLQPWLCYSQTGDRRPFDFRLMERPYKGTDENYGPPTTIDGTNDRRPTAVRRPLPKITDVRSVSPTATSDTESAPSEGEGVASACWELPADVFADDGRAVSGDGSFPKIMNVMSIFETERNDVVTVLSSDAMRSVMVGEGGGSAVDEDDAESSLPVTVILRKNE